MNNHTLNLLRYSLQTAVPLWVLQRRFDPWDIIQERAKICSQYIAEHGDVILYRGDKKGETATAFNHLAEGVACLSFAPGGVKLFGDHYENIHGDDPPEKVGQIFQRMANQIENIDKETADDKRGIIVQIMKLYEKYNWTKKELIVKFPEQSTFIQGLK